MLFSSLVFISVFLPLVLFICFCAPRSWRNNILLAASLIFYAWGEMVLVWVMILSIIWNHLLALMISRNEGSARKIWLFTGVAADLLLLGYYKYMDFFLANCNVLFHTSFALHKIILPIGISFYTFQAISYLVDVYRNDTPAEKNILNTGLYITFFPQLIAGPIVKFHEISAQIRHRQESMSEFACGMQRFIEGLAKKVLIANVMAETADTIFACDPGVLTIQDAWLGALAYTMQIFFDFSGYSDMAIGLGHLFGFTIPENFNYPYTAVTITGFWRKWHISLSSWFREYLYIPLGGSRSGKWATLRNLLIVFLVTGFWHGAGWTFILWGLWHGIFIIIERIFALDKRVFPRYIRIFQHAVLLLIVIAGWVLFRAETVSGAWGMVKKMFSFSPNSGESFPLSPLFIVTFIFAVFFSTDLPRRIYNSFKDNTFALLVWRAICCGLLFLVLLRLAGAAYNPFIYFRF